MIDDDIDALMHQGPDRSLDRLEADIWVGVKRRDAERQTGRVIARCQATVMLFALLGSAVAGAAFSASAHPARTEIPLAGSSLTPTALLLGQRP